MEVLLALRQWSNPALDLLMEAVTMLGEQVVLAAVVCLIYWCADKEMGMYVLVSLCVSLCANGLIKDLVRAPRPFWEPGMTARRVETATGYSFPSGHSQSAAAAWSAIAIWGKKRRLWVLAGILLLSVGFSRLYLGLHYPADVICGLLLGLGGSLAVWLILRKQALGIALILLSALAAACLIVGESEDTFSAVGLAIGLLPGVRLESRVNFTPPRTALAGFVRLFAGFLCIGAVYLVPGLLLERSIPMLTARNALIAFVAAGGYPWLFTKLEASRARQKRYRSPPR